MLDFNQGAYDGVSNAQDALHFPEVLSYEDARSLVWSAPESAPLLGINSEGEPVSVDLDSDSPHILISAATGGGKSVIARAIATQALVNGATVVILDAKRHSHRWAKNLPGVHYASTFPEIGNALVSVGMELHRRNEVVEEWPGEIETAPVGPRIVVIFEEMNATMDALKSLTKKIPEGSYDAEEAFRDIMFMGRAAKTHVIGIAQFASAHSVGGSAVRENFSTRILVRYTKQAWTMLAWDCGLPQAAPKEKGRGMVCRGGTARQTQFVYFTEEECASLVRSAYEARERAGLIVHYSEDDLRAQSQRAQLALMAARPGKS
jgi:hypothetical protein